MSFFVAFRGRFVLFQPSSCRVPFLTNWKNFQGRFIAVSLEPVKMICPVPGMKHALGVLLALCCDELF